MKLENLKVNFLGDSITEGVGVEHTENIFLNRLAKKYHWQAARNYGIGGTRIAQQAIDREPGWNMDFCTRALEMDPDADLIVVFGGTNDFGHGDVSLGDFRDRANQSFYGACHTLMTELLERYPGKPIVFLTPLHRLEEDSLHGDGRKTEICAPLSEYVSALKQVAEYYSLPVLDLWAKSGIQPKVQAIRERFCPDGLHPNDDGHAILADRIGAFLESL